MKAHQAISAVLFAALFYLITACDAPMPKPRGMLRIDLPAARYADFSAEDRPYTFHVSRLATVQLPPLGSADERLRITYPAWGVIIYCNSTSVTPATLPAASDECRELVRRSVREARAITEQAYDDPAARVYGVLFRIVGDSPAPIRFILTDSATRFFEGALYYPGRVDPDSVAPLTDYLLRDVTELIQSFRWK